MQVLSKTGARAVAVLPLMLAALLIARINAHEIPADVRAFVFVKPHGERLEVLVRVPLSVARDVVYPELDGGFLDAEGLRPRLPELARLWIADAMEITEDGRRLGAPVVAATQLSFSADTAFQSYESAVARVRGSGFGNEARVVWNQLWFDVLLEYSIRSAGSSFAIRTGFERLGMRVATAVRFLPDASVVSPGTERVYSLHTEGGSGDTGLLELDPSWHQAAGRFVAMGVEHILGGIDHLLFLFCLIIPMRRPRSLLIVVTAFTVAHSITLITAAAGYVPDGLWFPPLIESLIALSILFMAIENIVGASAGTAWNPNGKPLGDSWRQRWAIAFGFGLIHGFGFSFAMREELQFAGGQMAASLLSFNVGVELGQILVLLAVAPLCHLLFRYVVHERIGTAVLSAIIAHTGWHWLLERGETLSRFWRE